MKSFTDLNQSQKLAEILPLESADMCYLSDKSLFPRINYNGIVFFNSEEETLSTIIPCWSLAALLSVYPMVVGRDMDMYCCWQNHKNLHSRHYDNPVDACYKMIIKLHEQKLL